jgi:hypothetical protein
MRGSPLQHAVAAPEAAEPGPALAVPAGHTTAMQLSVAAVVDGHAPQHSSPGP